MMERGINVDRKWCLFNRNCSGLAGIALTVSRGLLPAARHMCFNKAFTLVDTASSAYKSVAFPK